MERSGDEKLDEIKVVINLINSSSLNSLKNQGYFTGDSPLHQIAHQPIVFNSSFLSTDNKYWFKDKTKAENDYKRIYFGPLGPRQKQKRGRLLGQSRNCARGSL